MQYRKKLGKYGFSLKHIVSAPFIWLVLIPVVFLHIIAEVYHQICFRLYGISLVKISDHIRIDRQHLDYLGFFEKINCMYCGYVNGFCSYMTEIAGRTELYWCAIKHQKSKTFKEPEHHKNFAKYGSKKDLERKFPTT